MPRGALCCLCFLLLCLNVQTFEEFEGFSEEDEETAEEQTKVDPVRFEVPRSAGLEFKVHDDKSGEKEGESRPETATSSWDADEFEGNFESPISLPILLDCRL